MSLQTHDRLLWPKGKRKAFTLSYDDGVTQDIRFIEMLNKYKLKGTFNLNSGLLGQPGVITIGRKPVTHNKVCPEDVKSIYAGHEVASHGLYMPRFATLTQPGASTKSWLAERNWRG